MRVHLPPRAVCLMHSFAAPFLASQSGCWLNAQKPKWASFKVPVWPSPHFSAASPLHHCTGHICPTCLPLTTISSPSLLFSVYQPVRIQTADCVFDKIHVFYNCRRMRDKIWHTGAAVCLIAWLPVEWRILNNPALESLGGTPHTSLSVPSFSLVTTEGGGVSEREREQGNETGECDRIDGWGVEKAGGDWQKKWDRVTRTVKGARVELALLCRTWV